MEDEAIIVLTYPNALAILQPSWNWPIGRKDIEIYGLTGAVSADNARDLRVRLAEGYDGYDEEVLRLDSRPSPYDDPFAFLACVVGGDIEVASEDLSALENNLTVVDILDAARRSAARGRTVELE